MRNQPSIFILDNTITVLYHYPVAVTLCFWSILKRPNGHSLAAKYS